MWQFHLCHLNDQVLEHDAKGRESSWVQWNEIVELECLSNAFFFCCSVQTPQISDPWRRKKKKKAQLCCLWLFLPVAAKQQTVARRQQCSSKLYYLLPIFACGNLADEQGTACNFLPEPWTISLVFSEGRKETCTTAAMSTYDVQCLSKEEMFCRIKPQKQLHHFPNSF